MLHAYITKQYRDLTWKINQLTQFFERRSVSTWKQPGRVVMNRGRLKNNVVIAPDTQKALPQQLSWLEPTAYWLLPWKQKSSRSYNTNEIVPIAKTILMKSKTNGARVGL